MRNRSQTKYACLWTSMLTLAMVLTPTAARSQPIGVEPAHPEAAARPSIGIEFGIGQEMQRGTFNCPCGTEYSGGSGSGYRGAVSYDLPIASDLYVGISGGYNQVRTTASFQENEIVIIELPSGDTAGLTLPMEHTGTVTLSFLRFEPYLQYQILHSNFFIQVGVGISIVTSSALTQTREMTNSTVVLSDGSDVNNLTFTNGSHSENIPGSTITGINKFQFSGSLSAGYNLIFGRLSASPIITYNYPFSTVQNAGNWKIASLDGSIRVGFGL